MGGSSPEKITATGDDVTLELDQANKTAEVNDSDGALVMFTGIVVCDPSGIGSNVQYVHVDIESRAEEFTTTISPSSVVFTSAGGSSAFTCSVRIPESTDSHVAVLIILGTYYFIPGGAQTYDIEPVKGYIEVIYTPSMTGEDGGGDYEGEGRDGSDDDGSSIPGFRGTAALAAFIVLAAITVVARKIRRQ